jgi:hypothetical protein
MSSSLRAETVSMLKWFFEQGVSSVDIHLRCPNFKNADYYSDDWMWLTRHQNLSFDQANRLLKWCRFKNYHGSDVFVRPHRHEKQPVIFLDDLSIGKAMRVSRKYRSMIVQTSHDNTQVWVSLSKKLSESERKYVQLYLSSLGFSDRGSISGEHLGRLCGLKSQKRGCWVTLITESSSKRYCPSIEGVSPFPQGGACAKTRPINSSMSEKDFSWALSKLRKGGTTQQIINSLEASAKARGKPAPMKYATRTVRRAMEILN